MYRMVVQASLYLINSHSVKPYGGGGSTGPHIYLGTRQTTVVYLQLQPLHPKYHMNIEDLRDTLKIVDTTKFVPLPECEPEFLGHAPHSPSVTMTQLPSILLLPSVLHSSSWIARICSQSQKLLTGWETFIKHSQKAHSSSPFSSSLIQSAYSHFIDSHSPTYVCDAQVGSWFRFFGQNSALISDISREFYMSSPSHSSAFCNHEITHWINLI